MSKPEHWYRDEAEPGNYFFHLKGGKYALSMGGGVTTGRIWMETRANANLSNIVVANFTSQALIVADLPEGVYQWVVDSGSTSVSLAAKRIPRE